MKQIKRELGMEKDEKETILAKFKVRLEHKVVPEAISNTVNDEMEKLSSLEPPSSEYNVTRNYLDWLTELPWGVYSQDSLDIARAETVLDEMHYGLKDVKERILEFIAVSGLRGNVQGKILLLSGPPGVGKTSIGRSIAKALNREFYRFSVGGMGDVAEIKGHRRTYVGAMTGKFVQALKNAKAVNPVIMIDEIDKMGRGWTGDPSSALLEALDPEQNVSFLDHYMDVPIDLSKVLFPCTANVLDTISAPLLDQAGLTEEQVEIREDGLVSWARDYCREAGVRHLKQQIEKIFRKVALRIVKDKTRDTEGEEKEEQIARKIEQVKITAENIEDYLGKKPFAKERLFDLTPPGIATGLAWTSMGGATLYIECVRIEGATENNVTLKVTGQLGDVMKESTDIALSYARNYMKQFDPSSKFFDACSLHMHVPEGATPKDGPSAGCTMVTALLSLALNRSIRQHVPMTGEVTLTGQVLPVRGSREKTIAAKRAGVKDIILLDGNRKDWDELPDHVSKDITPHFAQHYDDAYRICFTEGSSKGIEKEGNQAMSGDIDPKPDSVSLSRLPAAVAALRHS
ncbi:Lon protease-like [Gracilariopsis chorda]|uniref:endopeptidase La n=1 Tax=Gracilariopsis chorda TaxID=448386 RepID=A0A2V3IIT6_9FLOR|nr:Lon protease-like [Gracilariopsis chorda]|eukprot:PXF41943.1 Lon protease-like [Gracilariopsis chorda]